MKEFMKKTLAVLLVLLMVMGACACGSDEEGAEGTEGTADTENTVNTEMTEEELAAFYESLEGEYQDTVDGRAVMEATAINAEGLLVVVHWSNSAEDYTQWNMLVQKGEDNMLVYSDGIKSNVNLTEDKEEIVYDNGSGYFTLEDGVWAWNGAYDADTTECRFEKTE